MPDPAHPDDPRVRFTTPDDTVDLELEYKFPLQNVDSGSRTVTHDVIGAKSVTQHLGAEARTVSFRGHCYKDEANDIDRLAEYDSVRVRSWRFNGFGIVETASTEARGDGGGKRDDLSERMFDYRLTLVETDPPTE